MKKGFTLAEVLLTLAIIGVIAALTIPAVVTKAMNHQYVTGLRKAYNTLRQIEREGIREYGKMQDWTWAHSNADFEKYFKSHFDIIQDCGVATDGGCFASKIKYIDGTDFTYGSSWTNAYRFVTADGMSWTYRTTKKGANITVPANTGDFFVDVNGQKGPNTWGRDIFMFSIVPPLGSMFPDGTVYYAYSGPGEYDDRTEERPIRITSFDTFMWNSCKTTGNNCAFFVLSDGKMNY